MRSGVQKMNLGKMPGKEAEMGQMARHGPEIGRNTSLRWTGGRRR